jgi:hypothetical protein
MANSVWTLLRVIRERSVQERSCHWTRRELLTHQIVARPASARLEL